MNGNPRPLRHLGLWRTLLALDAQIQQEHENVTISIAMCYRDGSPQIAWLKTRGKTEHYVLTETKE